MEAIAGAGAIVEDLESGVKSGEVVESSVESGGSVKSGDILEDGEVLKDTYGDVVRSVEMRQSLVRASPSQRLLPGQRPGCGGK
jgi:hypothetical protein